MAAREQDDAIGHSLLAQTNPDSLERPCYLPWLHFLVIRSNLVPDRHLWTASEFSIPHYKLEDTTSDAILPEFCDEEDTGPLGLTFDPNRAAESPSSGDFAAQNPFYAPIESPARSARERKALRQRPQAPEVRERSPDPHPSLPLPRYLDLSPNLSQTALPLSGNLAGLSGTETSPSVTLPANTSIMVTPAKSERDEEVPSREDDKEKVDTFRVVDFAVVYLMHGPNSERIQKQVFTLHEFGLYYTPVLAEGKRPPQQDNLGAAMMKRLKTLIVLAQRDINDKKRNFFERYGCKSIIGIAFSGPYWTFSICRHDDKVLRWSKAISPKTSSHATILDTIFEAAESDPINPGGHLKLQELFRLYERAPTNPFQLVTGTYLECFPPN